MQTNEQGQKEQLIRAAFVAGFGCCRGYGDNFVHFDGEQKERILARYVAEVLPTVESDALAQVKAEQLTKDDFSLAASIISDIATEDFESEDPDVVAEAPILRQLARRLSIAALSSPGGQIGNRQIDLVCRSWNQIAYHVNGEEKQRTLTLSTAEDASKVWTMISNAHVPALKASPGGQHGMTAHALGDYVRCDAEHNDGRYEHRCILATGHDGTHHSGRLGWAIQAPGDQRTEVYCGCGRISGHPIDHAPFGPKCTSSGLHQDETGWQPIETAPEALPVLLYNPEYREMVTATRENQWWVSGIGEAYELGPGYTLWKHLPAAPLASSGVGAQETDK